MFAFLQKLLRPTKANLCEKSGHRGQLFLFHKTVKFYLEKIRSNKVEFC